MWNFKRNIYRTRREDGCTECIAHDITIGTQTWTGCNADTEFYNNGDPIPYVDDAVVWASLTTGAWCWYDNNSANETIYGKLYNWYAVNDPRGIAPAGYHVPSEAEYITLTSYLGSDSVAGGKLKESGFCHWLAPNTDATNTSGFSALPGGVRTDTGIYLQIGTGGEWWTSTITNSNISRHLYLLNFSAASSINNYFNKGGLSLRFIKDEVIPCPTCIAHDVTIGLQTWTGCNLDVDTYRNGDSIPEVSDPIAWIALTTGAWCWYANYSINGPIYGKLYNWHAVNDPRGLAPVGYHVPTDAEWTVLTDYLGGLPVAGGAMKEEGFCHWETPNTGATNTSLFTGLPGGYRDDIGDYGYIGSYGFWWSSTEGSINGAWFRFLFNIGGNANKSIYDKTDGLSVRLIKDCPTCIDGVVTIDTQTWTICNTDITEYRDGTPIPEITDPVAWGSATTGAWCYYANNSANGTTYGRLYNWYAAAGIYDAASLSNPLLRKQFAPLGYHVPSTTEFTDLIGFLGGATAGGKLKEAGFTHWNSPNTDATNLSCFTGLPGGMRGPDGTFSFISNTGEWWSTTETITDNAGGLLLFAGSAAPNIGTVGKNYARSIRFIQD